MKVQSFLGYFSGNLEIVRRGKKIYVIDNFHADDSEYDYGVWETFESKEVLIERTKGMNCADLVPDIYFDGQIDFLFNDDFPNYYGMSEETIKSIESVMNVRGFVHLDEICKEYGELKAYEDLKDICSVLRGEEPLEFDDIEVDTECINWFCTDNDCMQYCKEINNKEYQFIQAFWVDICGDNKRAKNAKDECDNYVVCAGYIDLDDYSKEDMDCVANRYGYSGLDGIEEIYGEEANRIIAECLFEDEYLYDSGCISDVISWDDARRVVDNYIEEN